MTLNWDNCPAVSRSSDVMSGAVVFAGTRVPVSALFENIEGGATIDDFLSWFEGVTKEQVNEVLEFATSSLAPA
ncbi:DUF433 domain-containing protein [Ereboglobus luteus]|uniref:DUF433 domain-containing protein n=1 Tax=Ereboglobus luteus TaxID=1796921 RepID=A0A2U8E7E9_9BACT|nr:DUF433 domain-containing protein [Ereboglobus luteus]AWI10532.1 hypothetical protein CKA38_05270 [Ereboglobus luteus]